jgi:hypothetical protein
LKQCAENRKRRLSALPNLRPYIYIYIYPTLKFLASQGAPYIYDISRLRVNTDRTNCCVMACIINKYGDKLNTDNEQLHK